MSAFPKEQLPPVWNADLVRIERHGGRSSDQWRVVGQWAHSSIGRDIANKRFARFKERMRQGGLRMMVGDKEVLLYTAPRLRTLW